MFSFACKINFLGCQPSSSVLSTPSPGELLALFSVFCRSWTILDIPSKWVVWKLVDFSHNVTPSKSIRAVEWAWTPWCVKTCWLFSLHSAFKVHLCCCVCVTAYNHSSLSLNKYPPMDGITLAYLLIQWRTWDRFHSLLCIWVCVWLDEECLFGSGSCWSLWYSGPDMLRPTVSTLSQVVSQITRKGLSGNAQIFLKWFPLEVFYLVWLSLFASSKEASRFT